MNPGPQLHRSLTFWAGLLVILFTCFAWRDSHDHYSSIYGSPGSLESSLHGLHIDWWANPGHAYFDWHVSRDRISPGDYASRWQGNYFPSPFLIHHQPNSDLEHKTLDRNVMAEAMQLHLNDGNPGSGMAFIPYWLILLTLIIIWTALLLRARRRRRASIVPPLDPISS